MLNRFGRVRVKLHRRNDCWLGNFLDKHQPESEPDGIVQFAWFA
jgi:hypothetical protein